MRCFRQFFVTRQLRCRRPGSCASPTLRAAEKRAGESSGEGKGARRGTTPREMIWRIKMRTTILKSALMASAAGLASGMAAQAADLPTKAKPVEYVKVCTLYGDGFYYIPGSDTCIKFGGYVRADYGFNTSGGRNPAYGGTQGAQDRTVAQYSTRHRGNLAVDTRTQTE